MGLDISLNKPHAVLWGRFARWWLAYVAVGLILGWRLGPRLDEFLFVLFLPLVIAVPWAILSLALAWLKLTACGGARATNTAPEYRLPRYSYRGQAPAKRGS